MDIDLGPPPKETHHQKLERLLWCLNSHSYEDAAGHLCDLLEHCRTKIITDEGMMFANLEAMVRKYGKKE